jgi:ribonuclease HI
MDLKNYLCGMGKEKYYVVWNGVNPGIYTNWTECRLQVEGYVNARYKSFGSLPEAREAFEGGVPAMRTNVAAARPAVRAQGGFVRESLAVDAACSGNPGDMEYRGVHVATGQQWFHLGPLKEGTNNVGEFLALVHGLAFLKRDGLRMPLYSDSLNAIKWVQIKQCRTKLARTAANAPVFDLIARAERWLAENDFTTAVLKWDTEAWGEIPADFGRKQAAFRK